jgi:hypothetical protein
MNNLYTLLRPQQMKLCATWVVCSLLGLLLSSLSAQAQSLQWSQFTSPKPNYGNITQNGTFSMEKVPNGPIYTLSRFHVNSGVVLPTFSSAGNQAVLGPSGATSYARTITVLSKYSADGSTLLWTRTLAPANAAVSGQPSLEPMDLELTASGEPIVLIATNAEVPALITADAYQLNSPPFAANGTSTPSGALVLNYFDTNGTLTYGTYIGPTGGPLNILPFSAATLNTPEFLKVAPDGTVQLIFGSNQTTPAHTGAIPTTAGAFIPEASHTQSTGFNIHLMAFNANHTLRFSTYLNYRSELGTAAIDEVIAPNGDTYITIGNGVGDLSTLFPTPTAGAVAPTANGNGMILRFNPQGQYVSGTFLPPGLLAPTKGSRGWLLLPGPTALL